jgi:hypothetical protein
VLAVKALSAVTAGTQFLVELRPVPTDSMARIEAFDAAGK